ncbi:MAG: DUF4292 domain-containing protein [Cytophagaceae bacterium]|nr:DUF4292 domain-containing protein [Cytophagaceae bacterium]
MNRFILVFSLSVILLSACKKQPATSGDLQKGQNHMEWTPLSFNYLVIKSKISFKSQGNSTNLTANIRIKKDSLIWLSITPGMGIEVVRAIITPDSVKVINRLDNKYDAYSISYIKQTLGINLNYYNLQNLLVGDMLLPFYETDQVITTDNTWQVKQQNNGLDVTSLISRIQKKVTQTEAINPDKKYLWSTYKDFILTDSVLFHQEQTLMLKNGNDTSVIEASHQKIEFPKKSVAFPFNIPKRFEK